MSNPFRVHVVCPTCGHAFFVAVASPKAVVACPSCDLSLRVNDNVAPKRQPESHLNPNPPSGYPNSKPPESVRPATTERESEETLLGERIAVIAGAILFLMILIGAFASSDSSSTPSPLRRPESTEDKLRRVYDSQGIEYDDQMIQEDARAIEQLHREFGSEL